MGEFIFSREHSSMLSSFHTFSIMRQKQELTDVRLVSNEGERILAHKVVLSSACSYFHSMFTLDLVESRNQEVDLRDFESDILNAVVLYCYGEEMCLSENNLDFLLRLTIAADRLRIEELYDVCNQFIISLISATNALSLQAFGALYGSSLLTDECTRYIEGHFEKVVKSQEFFELTLEDVVKMISSDSLDVSGEEVVYQAVMDWVLHNPEERKSMLPEILIHVRLPFVSPQYLQEVIEKDILLKDDLFCQGLIQEARFYKEYPGKRSALNISPRAQPRKGSIDSDIIVASGGIDSCGPLDSLAQYSPQTNKWTSFACLPRKLYGMGACFLDNCFYIIGGHCSVQGVLSAVYCYNLKENTWTQLASMVTPRRYLGVAVVHGLLYAVGGHTGSRVTSSVECYDPDRDTWTPCNPMNESRMYHGTVEVERMIYVVGGHNGCIRLDSLECYNPFTEKWVYLAPMGVPRSVVGVAVHNGSIIVAGGYSGNKHVNIVEEYDVELNKWTAAPSMTTPRSAFGLVTYMGALYAVGGFNGSFLSSVEQYIPGDCRWAKVKDMDGKRAHFGISSCGVKNW